MANTDKRNSPPVTFSFVAPVFNEARSLPAFYAQLRAAADKLGDSYEIVLVNDGSTDESLAVMRRLRETDDRVRFIDLSRNFGQQEALTAGYDYANGAAVISLDADGQHPPGLIADLAARWRQGFEVVYTIRTNTKKLSLSKRVFSRLFYRAFKAASQLDVADQADFRLLDRKVVLALRQVREKGRFLRGLVGWVGFRQCAVKYQAEERLAGATGYSLKKMLRLAGAGIFNFSRLPLHAISVAGGLLLAGALVYGLIALMLWPITGGKLIPNIIALAIGLTGMQMLAIGIVGEYIGRTFEEAKNRPIYIVREATGFEVPEEHREVPEVDQPAQPTKPQIVEPTRIRLFT